LQEQNEVLQGECKRLNGDVARLEERIAGARRDRRRATVVSTIVLGLSAAVIGVAIAIGTLADSDPWVWSCVGGVGVVLLVVAALIPYCGSD
jgi:peptidoglycan/LPS O-acetylase OafA/YrhL